MSMDVRTIGKVIKKIIACFVSLTRYGPLSEEMKRKGKSPVTFGDSGCGSLGNINNYI